MSFHCTGLSRTIVHVLSAYYFMVRRHMNHQQQLERHMSIMNPNLHILYKFVALSNIPR